jgi:TetR/AcrR family transcriptional repressor of nem operon
MTSIGDLEVQTGLDRSSLYNAFGNKHALFEAALRDYVESNIGARLVGLHQAGAGLDAIVTFFVGMAQAFRADPTLAARGCLVVNSVAELGARDPYAVRAGADYRDRMRDAFVAALTEAAVLGQVDSERIRPRADILATMMMGLFLTARIDAAAAAAACDSVASEASSWRLRPS